MLSAGYKELLDSRSSAECHLWWEADCSPETGEFVSGKPGVGCLGPRHGKSEVGKS